MKHVRGKPEDIHGEGLESDSGAPRTRRSRNKLTRCGRLMMSASPTLRRDEGLTPLIQCEVEAMVKAAAINRNDSTKADCIGLWGWS